MKNKNKKEKNKKRKTMKNKKKKKRHGFAVWLFDQRHTTKVTGLPCAVHVAHGKVYKFVVCHACDTRQTCKICRVPLARHTAKYLFFLVFSFILSTYMFCRVLIQAHGEASLCYTFSAEGQHGHTTKVAMCYGVCPRQCALMSSVCLLCAVCRGRYSANTLPCASGHLPSASGTRQSHGIRSQLRLGTH